MSEDMSAMLRTGATLVLVAALIAGILNIVSIATTAIGSSMTKVQSGTSTLAVQEFQSYNQETIAGTEVLSALNLFNDRDIALVVVTNAQQKSGSVSGNNYGAVLEGFKEKAGTGAGVSAGNVANGICDIAVSSAVMKAESCVAEIKTDATTGNLVYNRSYKISKTKGQPQFINATGKFYCTLIYDDSGDVIGVLMVQK